MKFSEMPYTRPDLAATAAKFQGLADKAKAAASGEELAAIFKEYSQIKDDVTSAQSIAEIRHTVDMNDEFYNAENDYFDENGPVVEDKSLAVYRALLASPFKDTLKEQHGQILIDNFEIRVKSSDERLVPLQQEENALATTYEKLYASAKIPFRGETLTVAQLTPHKQNPDRAIRKEAFEAEGGFFDSHREELDEIYDKMVKNRTEQAKMLGYDTFTPLGDIRMQRNGYGRKEVAALREEVVKGIVPADLKLKATQARRIGVSKLAFYDDPLSFADGNPTPKGTPEEILAAGQAMYHGLSPETAEFIDFMMERDLFDVLAKPGKAPGGYCTTIPNQKCPFIFSNFNGTAGDVDVLTHEAGHAFADYVANRQNLPEELRNPGLESCEIHSMSMEFLTSDYHHLFFKEDTAKYELSHLEDALFFLPYGCQVDEFQETVYNNPGLTPAERNALWLDLEKKYRPWNDFEDLPFYGRGAGWQRQLHIYEMPFYYIDYVLAQSVALQFFLANNVDKKDAWQRYLALVNKAGTTTYPGLVGAAGFAVPYTPGALKKVGDDCVAFAKGHELG